MINSILILERRENEQMVFRTRNRKQGGRLMYMYSETKNVKSIISGMLLIGGFLVFILSAGMSIL